MPRWIMVGHSPFPIPLAALAFHRRFYDPDGHIRVGPDALEGSRGSPGELLDGIPRLLGARHDSPEFQFFREQTGLEVTEKPNGRALISIADRRYDPAELCARLLHFWRFCAEQALEEDVDGAVIAIPAAFGRHQRQAAKDAGLIAGLDVHGLISHSTAAALAWGFETQERGAVVVCDFGAGTLDISVLDLQEGKFRVLASGGDTCLGGMDMDGVVLRWLETATESNRDDDNLQLRQLAEVAKIDLSSSDNVDIPWPGRADFGKLELTRDTLEQMVEPLLERAVRLLERVVLESGTDLHSIAAVLLLGGSSRIPRFVEQVESTLGKRPHILEPSKPWAACGAAILSGILDGSTKNLSFLDVLPRTLGIGLVDGSFVPIFSKSSNVPSRKVRYFEARDFANNELRILAGESLLASENDLVTTHPIPKSHDPDQRFRVTIEIDVNGSVDFVVCDPVDSGGDIIEVTERDRALGDLQGLVGSAQKTYQLLHPILSDEQRTQAEETMKQAEQTQNGSLEEIQAVNSRLEEVHLMFGVVMLGGGPPGE